MADAIMQLPDGGDDAITHLVTLLPPDELAVAYDYLPIWLNGGASSGEDEYDYGYEDDFESSNSVEISDLAVLSVEGDELMRRVRVDGFTVHTESTTSYTEYNGDPYSSSSTSDIVFDGECFEVTSTYDSTYSSNEDPEVETVCKGDVAGSGEDGASILPSLGAWAPTLTVVEVDGRWYVSPVRSVLDSVVDGLRAMSPEDLQKFVDEWSDGFFGDAESRFESVGPAIPEDGSGSISTSIRSTTSVLRSSMMSASMPRTRSGGRGRRCLRGVSRRRRDNADSNT